MKKDLKSLSNHIYSLAKLIEATLPDTPKRDAMMQCLALAATLASEDAPFVGSRQVHVLLCNLTSTKQRWGLQDGGSLD